MDRLAEFAERGLVLTRGTTVTISPVGRPYARLVASAFDTALQAREARFSTAV
jgi:oxygen-independent coproporphyrinogen-3 oxidase